MPGKTTRNRREKTVELARALSKLGFCSRSNAEKLIRAGRVQLNGTLRSDPQALVHLAKDRIEVDGALVAKSARVYLALNKPRGVVTTADDDKDRETVYAYLAKNLPWVAPVGRLDKASEGLLLITNDSEWAARISAPETHLDKTYHVQIAVLANELFLEALRNGILSPEGEVLRVKRVSLLRQGQRNSWLEMVLDEGKNRHIRRMFEHLEVDVLRLIRVAIGPLGLDDLAKGATRALRAEEKQALDRAMQPGTRGSGNFH